MAVGHEPVKGFEDWYLDYREDTRDGCLDYRGMSQFATDLWAMWERYKREMDSRVANYDKLVKLVDAEVISPKDDLPNISSGETAGMVRRMARNLVQHTPNVEVVCEFDDDSARGIFARHILKTKIIGDDLYSNNMQQKLFASAKTSLTLGFAAVIPVLLQDALGGWYMKYDSIYYRDVFPEPGAKDIRTATDAFIRRYLTVGEIKGLIRNQVSGWDVPALKRLLKTSGGRAPSRDQDSVDLQTKKHHTIPEGYEIITYYSNTGDPFLTFSATDKTLLRIEVNKDPLKRLPVFFLVMEYDENQPLGKSQVELVLGRQEFQDLLLNGAMKMYYRNINPSIIGYGVVNGALNLSPGKYNEIQNPNARIEAFEVNTQTLLQYGTIATQNAGNMQQLIGATDQQAASQSSGGMMSQTPQGVEAQQQMVDITTNNYQKAVEAFFSQYCSYALTLYFQELKGFTEVKPTADTRQALLGAGMDPKAFVHKEHTDAEGNTIPADGTGLDDGALDMKFSDLATEYWVRTVPGSLVELEDEKQVRILNELFVPLSQAMPALAASGDQEALGRATAALLFIVQKQLELSGSTSAHDLKQLLKGSGTPETQQRDEQRAALEEKLGEVSSAADTNMAALSAIAKTQQEQIGLLSQGMQEITKHLGIPTATTGTPEPVVAQ